MTRGNQRELARQKNLKKQTDSGKGKRRDDGLSAAARKQRDSEIMQQKQKKADEKKDGREVARGRAGPPPFRGRAPAGRMPSAAPGPGRPPGTLTAPRARRGPVSY
ncbi:small EDRK-rich factor 2 [Pterocles gutturalis]